MNRIDTTPGAPMTEFRTDVGKYQPIFYAGAGGDFNPIHIDPEFGKMVGLGGNILQGLCTMAFVAQGVQDWAGDPRAIRRLKVRFEKNVKPGDTVFVRGKVTGTRGNLVDLEVWAENQNGEKVISNASATVQIG